MRLTLHRRGVLRLPPAAPGPPRRQRPSPAALWPAAREPVVRATLQDFQPITVLRIDRADGPAGRVWTEMMQRSQPLGAGPLWGAQLRDLLWSPTQGWLGGLAFSAAAWRVAARDRWIGWTDAVRQRHLTRVVTNSRVLLPPQLHVPHLASYVLGRVLRRLPADWQTR